MATRNDLQEVDARCEMKSSIFWCKTLCSPLKVNLHVLPKLALTFNVLHSLIFKKIEVFITRTVIKANPAFFLWHKNPCVLLSEAQRKAKRCKSIKTPVIYIAGTPFSSGGIEKGTI
jgi:hypothetical protein